MESQRAQGSKDVNGRSARTALESFIEEARAFLDGQSARHTEENARQATGRHAVTLFPERTAAEQHAELAAARRWRRAVFDAGFGWIDGPPEHGGRGLPTEFARAYDALERTYVRPFLGMFGITYGMVAPTTLAHGSPEAKQRFLHGYHRGDLLACQLFSEPDAGSDLASVATAARPDGDAWVVSGQKVWTSHAQLADVGLLLARTDPEAAKHRGLTMFLVDMHAAGVEVRPLRQMTGGCSFNEVFLTDVRVPDALRLGAAGDGWRVAHTTLLHERAFVGEARRFPHGRALIELVARSGADDDPVLRQELARIHIADRLLELTTRRARAQAAAGSTPGPERSIAKLALTANLQRIAEAAGRVLGPRLQAGDGTTSDGSWSDFVLSVPGVRLAGGTDEIQRNVVAERILGLPREPRPGERSIR